MPKKKKYFENLPVQRWMQSYLQSIMDEQYSLKFLENQELIRWFKKFGFDHYSSGLCVLLAVISYTWFCLRYGRLRHPGSAPLRLGHHRLLAALSSAGKDQAVTME
eukprot:737774_1